MDTVSKNTRSRMMSRIRGKNTQPEKAVRRISHALGFRFRLHRKDLPGKPDLVFPRLRKAIFVNGCFWHQHKNCKFAYTPKSNVEFWNQKFEKNLSRDALNVEALEKLGWIVLVVWECETRDSIQLYKILRTFLTSPALVGCSSST
ncbi:very short patch repair endonuclease [Alcaligenaceae bacterium B3P038]|nr:very short patch repair endonuclease [Alcaligenaceae bacterium B3P038]